MAGSPSISSQSRGHVTCDVPGQEPETSALACQGQMRYSLSNETTITTILVLRYVKIHLLHSNRSASPTHPNMISQRFLSQASRLTSQNAHSPILRTTLQRRFASKEAPKLVGPMDNAFNRERLAVKAHAAQSAGTSGLR